MRRRRTLVAAAAALLVAACTADDPGPRPIEAGPEPSGEQPQPTPAPAPESPPEGGHDPLAGLAEDEVPLVEAWLAFRAVWDEQIATGELDAAAFTSVTDGLDAIVARGVPDPVETVAVEHWPSVDTDDDGVRYVLDCLIAERRPVGGGEVETVSEWAIAEMRETDQGWVVVDQALDARPCVAAPLADELIAAYEEFRRAKNAAWDPPDPDAPELEAILTGSSLTFFRDQIAADQAAGVSFREPAPTDNAVVFAIGIGTATVADCHEQVEDYGVYDVATGERLDDQSPPVEPGRRDLVRVDVVRDETGRWLVEDTGASRGVQCEPGETDVVVR